VFWVPLGDLDLRGGRRSAGRAWRMAASSRATRCPGSSRPRRATSCLRHSR